MNYEESNHREIITLRDYVDIRFDANDKALELALNTVKESTRHDEWRLSLMISILSLVVSLSLAAWVISRHSS